MPKSPEQFNVYSEEKALDEARRMQEKISKEEAKNYNEAEMQIEQEEAFPEQFKFDLKQQKKPKYIGQDAYDATHVWVDLKGTPFARKDYKGEEYKEGNMLSRDEESDLVEILKIFGEEGLQKFLRFYRIKINELKRKNFFNSFAGFKEEVKEKNFPDSILHSEFVLSDEKLSGENEAGINKITGFEVDGVFYKFGEKEVAEIEESYSGGNSLQGESSTFYRVKRNRPCWHKSELNKEILQDFNISGVGIIPGVKLEKQIPEKDSKEQATPEMIDEFDFNVIKEIADLENEGGKNKSTWYFNRMSENEIVARRGKGERIETIEREVKEKMSKELLEFLQETLGDKKLEGFGIKGEEDIKIEVEVNSESFPRYFSVTIERIGRVDSKFLHAYCNFGDRSKENIQNKTEDIELRKLFNSFRLQNMVANEPKIEKPKFDKTLSVQEHQGRIGFKPTFEDVITFYDLDDQKLSKALVPGQEYQVVFVGEKKPMMDFNKKEQRKDKRGTPMFRQKVKLVL